MSISPTDSFDSDFSNDGGIQTAPASKSSSKKGCLIGALIAFLVLMLVCCGGMLFLFYFGPLWESWSSFKWKTTPPSSSTLAASNHARSILGNCSSREAS